MRDVNQIDRWFRRALVSSALILIGLKLLLGDEYGWLNGITLLVMAGVVGYFTNFLALKMLFQPKQGKVLGWEGLVPKNKHQIARQLGESVQTQLLSPDILMEYIAERELIERGTRHLTQWVDTALQDPVFQRQVNGRIIELLKERGPEALIAGFDYSEVHIKTWAKDPQTVTRLWAPLRERMVTLLQQRTSRDWVAGQLRKYLLEVLPSLAQAIDEAIDIYLDRRKSVGRVGKQLKSIASFDQAAIHELLERFVNDEAAQDQLIGVVDILIERLEEKLEAPETQALIEERVEVWLETASTWARDRVLPMTVEGIQAYLSDEQNWDTLDTLLTDLLRWSAKKLADYVESEEGQALLKSNIDRLVKQLDVTSLVEEQVIKLDTDELEKMILDNTGGNLVVIQVLGGVLGMVVGTIQVNVLFAFPVMALAGLVWVLAWFNKQRA